MAQSRPSRLLIFSTIFVCILVNCISKSDASESVYSVNNIVVDFSAASSAAARVVALEKGKYLAFNKLCDRLVIAEDIQFLESVSLPEIEGMIESYIIEKEVLSSTRYKARLTFEFKRNIVSNFLKNNQIRFAEGKSKERLVIPILELPNGERILWQEPRNWSNSWLVQANTVQLVPLIVPLGDITDIQLISAKTLIATSWDTLLPLAERYEVEEVIIVLAKVKLKTFKHEHHSKQDNLEFEVGSSENNPDSEQKLGHLFNRTSDRIVLYVTTHIHNALGFREYRDVLESGDEESFNEILLRGANEIAKSIQETWKKDNVLKFGLENVMRISIPLSELRDWIEIRRKLSHMAVIKNVNIISLSLHKAELNIDYLGETDQLVTALKQKNLQLSYGLEGWLLQTTSSSRNIKLE